MLHDDSYGTQHQTYLFRVTVCLFLFSLGKAVLHAPFDYTHPTGLQSVNGSDPFGGCPQTPQNCVVMTSGVDVCQCPGDNQATGVLIDGVVPTIDPVSDINWASGLFTVNRNGQDSVMIGFSFASTFNLRGVEIKLFNCLAWNIAASTINVYGSLSYPTFFASPSTSIGTVDILNNENCASLTTVTIPVQLPSSGRAVYFIEFTFNNDPSIEWAPSIAEIQFSDETPTQPPVTVMTTMSSTTSLDMTTFLNTPGQPTTASTIDTTTSHTSTADLASNTKPPTTQYTTMSATMSPGTTEKDSTQINIVLTVLVIVFGLGCLILSIALVVVSARLHVYYKKSIQPVTQSNTEEEYDDVLETDNNTIEMKHNEAYGNTRQTSNRKDQEETATYEVIAN